MIQGKVSCLMATAGRPAFVRRAIDCFAAQDYPNRELVILNNHPDRLFPIGGWTFADGSTGRVIEGEHYPTLGHCRNRLLLEADGEFLRIWDDDDLYFPWAISQGVERIDAADAWKPARSWWCDGTGLANGYKQEPGTFALANNAMEASITWETDFVRDVGGWYAGQGNESRPLLEALNRNGGLKQEEMGAWAGYCYMHGCGQFHASATIGDGRGEEARAAEWQTLQHARPCTSYLEECRRLVHFIEPRLQTAWMRAALGAGPAHAPPEPVGLAPVITGRPNAPVNLAFAARHGPDHSRSHTAAPGCWDLLHEGHAKTLAWAALQRDGLVVLVNDDAGVCSQKGVGRPLVPLEGRIASLNAMACVDMIMVVEGIDDRPWLDVLGPAAVVKGPDYAGREAEVQRPAGCEVLIAPESCRGRHHTSELLARASALLARAVSAA